MLLFVGVLFILFILVLVGHCLRRHLRLKRITFSRENLFDDSKSMQKR